MSHARSSSQGRRASQARPRCGEGSASERIATTAQTVTAAAAMASSPAKNAPRMADSSTWGDGPNQATKA